MIAKDENRRVFDGFDNMKGITHNGFVSGFYLSVNIIDIRLDVGDLIT